MTPRKRRMVLVATILVGVSAATALAVSAFRENMLYFFSPSQVTAGAAPVEHTFRLGGLVESGSVQRAGDGLTVRFAITDTAETIPVTYTGILPDLFREGQGVVALGKLGGDGLFRADQVLAKHDENYMPPEVADALKVVETNRQNATLAHPGGSGL